MSKSLYTHGDLIDNAIAYNRNVRLLESAKIGSKEHDEAVKEERRLNDLEVKMKDSMAINTSDICPLSNSVTLCDECSGWFKSVGSGVMTKYGENKVNEMQEVGEGHECVMKDIKENNNRITMRMGGIG